jgi:fatty-acyl-CoA synthase
MPKRNSKIYPGKIGLVDGDKRFSYKELNLRINRLGNALRDLGLKKGDKIAVMADNCHQFLELYFALAKTGLVIVPVNTRFLVEEASHVISHSESCAFVYH